MDAKSLLAEAWTEAGPIVFLTGAGISAESGIPTFRGPEGYWRIGSRNYQPMELATRAAFAELPGEVWRWYLYRRSVCRAAAPNPAHDALAQAEDRLPHRFLLVTQNVDGLHLRAGNTLARTYQIHGNIDYHRCAGACTTPPRPLPPALGTAWDKSTPLDEKTRSLLTCTCGDWMRPHVLWFDESYDEPRFRYDSTLRAMQAAAALVVIGTSGATTLPARMCEIAAARAIPFIVIDQEATPFSQLASSTPNGGFVAGRAGEMVPALLAGFPPA
jgi:NAD-dependent deacetylase